MENDSTEVAEALEERKSFSSHWVDCWAKGAYLVIVNSMEGNALASVYDFPLDKELCFPSTQLRLPQF
ncbi:hypothetical protein LINPERHAP1_LOCUS439 [Linum perenne]